MTPTIVTVVAEIDRLRNELDQARIDRDTARAQVAGMQGRGM